MRVTLSVPFLQWIYDTTKCRLTQMQWPELARCWPSASPPQVSNLQTVGQLSLLRELFKPPVSPIRRFPSFCVVGWGAESFCHTHYYCSFRRLDSNKAWQGKFGHITLCKVKFTLEQAMKAQSGNRYLAVYSFFNLGARWRWEVNATSLTTLCGWL
jgi:hypothetical protein